MSGDPGWIVVHDELVELHVEKARDYGNDGDALANYVLTSSASGQVAEFTCWLRVHEKCIRALNMLASGREDEIDEGKDVAALALAAEALKRRRTTKNEPSSDRCRHGYSIKSCPDYVRLPIGRA